jgi:DNA-binding response OmpR family regulator
MAGPYTLVVEDDELISSFIVRALQRTGHDAKVAASGAAATQLLASGDVVLLLLDLTLPDIDGLDVLSHARSDHPHLPVVVLTSRSDPKDRAAAESLGVDRYLVKPFPLSELLAIVAALRPS